MVKITNEFGDVLKGKTGNAVYQEHYGRQIRRKAYKENKKPSESQIQVRNNFKKSIEWVKSLTHEQREDLKSFYKNSNLSYSAGNPINWYNFAKWLYIKKPEFRILDPETAKFEIKHPALYSVTIKNPLGFILYQETGISSFNSLFLNKKYIFTPVSDASTLIITLLTGLDFEYTINTIAPELEGFDINCFDANCFI